MHAVGDGAAYLELAQRRHLPLATLDHEFAAAAQAAGTKTMGLPDGLP
jgi:hypothetical protein